MGFTIDNVDLASSCRIFESDDELGKARSRCRINVLEIHIGAGGRVLAWIWHSH